MSTLSTLAGDTPTLQTPETPKPARVPIRGIREGEHVEVIPYDGREDTAAFKFIPWFWERLKNAGLLDLYYPGNGATSFPSFVRLLSGDVRVILFVIRDTQGEVSDCIGFATWAPIEFGGCQVGNAGFVFLPEYWDRQTTINATRVGMKFWFDQMTPKLDVAIGMNPEGNHLVQRFLHRIGWTRVGTLPLPQFYAGKTSDLVLWYYTRKQYELDKEKA